MSRHTDGITERCAAFIMAEKGYVGKELLCEALGVTKERAQQVIRDMCMSPRYGTEKRSVPVKIGPRTYHTVEVKVTSIRPDPKAARALIATAVHDSSIVHHYHSAYSTQVDGFDSSTVLLAARGMTRGSVHAGFIWKFKEVESV